MNVTLHIIYVEEKFMSEKRKSFFLSIFVVLMLILTVFFVPSIYSDGPSPKNGTHEINLEKLVSVTGTGGTTTLLEEGFEGSIFPPSGWTSTGWLDSYYGSAHSGSGWAYSWGAGDTLTTPLLTFGTDTELSFWFGAENAAHPMSLQVKLDNAVVLWSESGFTHSYVQAVVDLSAYSGSHTINFIGLTSDMYGQLLDDILVTTSGVSPVWVDSLTMDFGDYEQMTFNISVEVVDSFLNLSVSDQLPEFLSYVPNSWDVIGTSLVPSFQIHNQWLYWNFSAIGDVSFTILFTAHIDDCGIEPNTVFAKGYYAPSESISNSDMVPLYIENCDDPCPTFTVEKQVKNGSTWSDYATFLPGEIVTFRVSIYNPCDEYQINWSGVIFDYLPCNLLYIPHSTVGLPLATHPDLPAEEINAQQNSVLWHVNHSANVLPHTHLNFTYQATAVCCGSGYLSNNLTAHPSYLYNIYSHTAIDNSNNAYDESDSAFVNVLCGTGIDVKKYSATDGQSNWNDSAYTKVPASSYPRYKIVVKNTGSITLNNVTVVDTLPDSFTYDGMDAGYQAPYYVSGQTIKWAFINLASNASKTLIFKAKFPTGVNCQGYTNSVSVTGLTPGSPSVSDSDSANVTVINCDGECVLHVSIVKYSATDGQSNWNDSAYTKVPASSYPRYKIVVKNTGSITLHNVTVVDTLPDSFTFDGMDAGYQAPYYAVGQTIKWSFIDLAANASKTLIFKAKFPSGVICQGYTNGVSVTGTTPGYTSASDSDSANVTVTGCEECDELHVSVVKYSATDGQSNWNDSAYTKVPVSSYPRYKIVVKNTGSITLHNVTVVDTLPDSFTFDGMDAGYQAPYYAVGQTIKWSFIDLAANASKTLIFKAKFPSGVICQGYTNGVSVTGTTPGYTSASDSDSANVTVTGCDECDELHVSVVKYSANDCTNNWNHTLHTKVPASSYPKYKIVVNNTGSITLNTVTVVDTLPDSFTYVAMVEGYQAPSSVSGQTITWILTNLAPGASQTLIFKAAFPVDVQCIDYENIVSVTGSAPGHVSVYATSSAWIKVIDCGPVETLKVSVVKYAANDCTNNWNHTLATIVPDTSYPKYKIVVNNTGNITLNTVTVVDTLPDSFTYVAMVEGYQAPSSVSGQTITWILTNLAPGASQTLIFKAAFPVNVTCGVYKNNVTVTASTPGYSSVSNSSSASIRIPCDGEDEFLMECEKLVRKGTTGQWVDNISADVGDTISFNIQMKNIADMPMHHIAVHDYLPKNLSYMENSAKLLYNGSYFTCEPDVLAGNVLFWSHVNECIPGSTEGEEAEYLMQNVSISLIFNAKINNGTGIVINNAVINGTMCYQNIPVDCSDTAEVNISIAPLVADAGDDQTKFVDDPVTFDASDTKGGVPPYTFTWDLDADGQYDDATGVTTQKTWTTQGTYTIGLKVVDSRGINDTDTTKVTVKTRVPNLECYGSLNWVNVSPRDTITGQFTVKNTGDPKSKLDWEIESFPEWGTWNFSVSNGTDLTPEQGSITVLVTLKVPRKRNEQYSGNITIINKETPTDTEQILISLATPRTWNHPLLDLIDQIVARFPALKWLLDFLRL